MSWMRKVAVVAIIASLLSVLAGCGASQKDPTPIGDVNAPNGYILPLEYDTPYVMDVKQADGSVAQRALKLHVSGEKVTFTWGDKTQTCNVLRASKRVAYLVYAHDVPMVYLYQDSTSSLGYYTLSDSNIGNRDNRQIKLLGQPTDPTQVACTTSMYLVGVVATPVTCYVDELGRLQNYPAEGEYCLVTDEFATEALTLNEAATVTVFPNAEATEGTLETLPAGTSFTRLRTAQDEGIADLLMKDGRVARFTQRYYFSEPSGFWVILDAMDQQVTFN